MAPARPDGNIVAGIFRFVRSSVLAATGRTAAAGLLILLGFTPDYVAKIVAEALRLEPPWYLTSWIFRLALVLIALLVMASVFYKQTKNEKAISVEVNWFEQARSDQGWWEPLAMVAGLLNDGELTHFVRDLNRDPILASMAISNAVPGSKIEEQFTGAMRAQLFSQIFRLQTISQLLLWFIAGVFVISAITVIHYAPQWGFVTSALLLSFEADYRDGYSAWLVFMTSFILCIVFAVSLSAFTALAIDRLHEHLLNLKISTRLDPLLLGLRYLAGRQSRETLNKAVDAINRSRWIDPLLAHRLRTYSDRLLPTDPHELAGLLNQPGMSSIALAVLSYRYERSFAAELIEKLPQRSFFRQSGELKLYQIWIQRYSAAHDELSILLRITVEGEEWPLDLRRRVAKMLRECGIRTRRIDDPLTNIFRGIAWFGDKIYTVVLFVFFLPLLGISILLFQRKGLSSFSGFLLKLASSVFTALPVGKNRWLGIRLARALYRANDADSARLILRQLEQHERPNEEVLFEFEKISAGDDEAVLQWQFRLLELLGDEPNVLYRIAMTYFRRNMYPAAEEFAMRSIENGGNTDDLFVNAAIIMFRAGKEERSISFLRDQAKMRPSSTLITDYLKWLEGERRFGRLGP
jgi:tetratricopeptide (TPR) repeat protein